MPNVERSAVKPPNDSLQGLARTRSASPAGSASPVNPPNGALRDGDPSSYGGRGYTKGPSPINLPDHRFNVSQAKMPQPPAAAQPGQGNIPVDSRVGMVNGSGMARKDTAKK